ncbi:MAG: nucleotidyltransferase [Alphaproteobacteria bacterium]|nr:nucleotidyltransferase [Alphaproteobacteria bacterium]
MKLPRADELPPDVSVDRLIETCRRWRIAELALFGSFARGEATGTSDIDLLVSYEPKAHWSLFDHVAVQQELAELFHRPVDLLTRRGVEESGNPVRRRSILESARVIYAA